MYLTQNYFLFGICLLYVDCIFVLNLTKVQYYCAINAKFNPSHLCYVHDMCLFKMVYIPKIVL